MAFLGLLWLWYGDPFILTQDNIENTKPLDENARRSVLWKDECSMDVDKKLTFKGIESPTARVGEIRPKTGWGKDGIGYGENTVFVGRKGVFDGLSLRIVLNFSGFL